MKPIPISAIPIPAMPIPAMVVERLGWVLLHSLWQFALIALIAAVTVRAMRRNSAAQRYGVLVVAMTASVMVSMATWMIVPGDKTASLAHGEVASGQASLGEANPAVDAAALDRRPILETEPIDQVPLTENEAADRSPATSPPALGNFHFASSRSERATLFLRPWLAWIVAGWSVGVVLCALRPLLGWYTLRRLRRVGVSPVSDDVLATLQRVSERLELRRVVRVLHSTLAQVPILVGYVRPVILLPVSLVTSVPAAQLEAILAHELAMFDAMTSS